jgi:hypothetical protein
MAKGANPPKGEFLGAVAGLKTGLTEFSYSLDQSSQAQHHLRLAPLIVNEWGEQRFVHPLRLNVHIN